jgi:hypothetical protein
VRHGQHSAGRPRTLLDLRWPDTEEYNKLWRTWSEDAIDRMLAAVWCGYDTLVTEVLIQVDTTEADEERERTITQLLEPRIRRHLSGDEPYDIQHGPYEYATRQPAPAQPPQYDIAFVLHRNPKVMWPLEAKCLRSDGAVADYVGEVRDNFLTGRYAPYASSGAMLGYLLHGSPERTFNNIEQAIACQLLPHPTFSTRQHRISDHSRNLARADFVSGPFRCHHLIMEVRRSTQTGNPAQAGLRKGQRIKPKKEHF